MSQLSQRLIFGKKDVLLQDSEGGQIRTFQKSDFLMSRGRYRVTEALLGDFSEGLLIEIEAPIEVEVTFEAQINAKVQGAIAHAKVQGAEAHATTRGAEANANADGAIAYADAPEAKAYANKPGAEAYAKWIGAEIHATVTGALAIPLS